MTAGWFITGTDTGVGKTYVARCLLAALAHADRPAVGMKPVASGCHRTQTGLRCDDAELLLADSSVNPDYTDVNPYAFAEPVAPHLAAAAEGKTIELEVIQERFRRLRRLAPYVVVEGAGGWRVPLDDSRTMADIAKALGLPAILVVGMRLGCLNQALLTVEAMHTDGVTLTGWVANQIDPVMERFEQNIATLEARIAEPLLGVLPYQARVQPEESIKRLNLSPLLSMHP